MIFTSACSFWPWLNHEFFNRGTITIIFVLPACLMKGNINSHHRLSFSPLISGFFLPSSSSYFYSHLFLSFSCSVMSDSLRPHGLHQARLPCPSPTLGAYSTHVHRVHDAIQPSHLLLPLLLLPSIFPSIRVFSNESVLCIRWPKYWDFQLQHVSFLEDWLLWALCSPRNSQESSPTPQLKSINLLVLSLLYGPTLISIHNYWKTIALTRWTFIGNVSAF